MASSDFEKNKAQGDWAEDVLGRAINEAAVPVFAVPCGRSDDLIPGQPGFPEHFECYEDELALIGKRPDLLLVRDEADVPTSPFEDLDDQRQRELVRRSLGAFEVRSSAFEARTYREFYKDDPSKSLSITPKVEDLRLVASWIAYYGAPHFYTQVFSDEVYAIAFEEILRLVASGDKAKFAIERDRRNAFKTTIKIPVRQAVRIGEVVVEPDLVPRLTVLPNGRRIAFVAFDGGEVRLDQAALAGLLGGSG
jgi:hypothetical protein